MTREMTPQNILTLMQRDDSVDAPADSIRWVSNLFRARAVEPKPTLIRKLAAVFQMEIKPGKPAFGERSSSTAAVRQVLYRADEHAIDIRIEAAKKGFSIRGQILGNNFAKASVRLFEDGRSFETTASEASEFRFDSIPAGRYDLTIQGDDVEITLKAIDIT
jgi:hypothetical protein